MPSSTSTARAAFVLALSAPLALAVACTSPPPPAPPPVIPPASTSVAETPPPPVEEPLAPGEVRCGIDDGPVPIGTRGDDLRRETAEGAFDRGPLLQEDGMFLGKRMMKMEEFDPVPLAGAAKPTVAMNWSLAEGLTTGASFEDRANACRDLALPADAGEAKYSVKLAAGGGPVAVRPAMVGRAPSKLTLCFAASLCALGPQAKGAPARRLDVQLRTTVTPPVFTGTVEIVLTGEHTPKNVGAPIGRPGRRGRRYVPPPPTPPLTAADKAYLAKTVSDAKPGALACAQRTPPAAQLFVSAGAVKVAKPASPYQKIDMAPPPRARPQNADLEYHRQMSQCVRSALEAVLTPPPKTFSDTGRVFASATFTPGPEAPPPPSSNKAPLRPRSPPKKRGRIRELLSNEACAPGVCSLAMRLSQSFRHLAPVLAAAGLLSLVVSHDAQAAWPPPENATPEDLAKPENWPSDSSYGYKAGATKVERKRGQWELFGFQPERSAGGATLRPAELGKPSGASVDAAWRFTIGDSRVKIAVLDSGIKWDERDLVEKAFINVGELAAHKPKRSDGGVCAGDGELAGFDCNGDGVVSAGDWADDPSLPLVGDSKIRGDKNGNGVLDAGDLILAFSDGKDDDGNGYVDDISGWDFLMDDNDPYDDTRYGHGTGEARDSTAQTNNGQGDAGVCPLCRFVPLRVGDSFIADAQDFAQAVVYATDNKISVVQEALGTINNSTYAQAALKYAYEHNVTVIASMADENSKHHNYPATNNWTLPVHAIVNDGAESDPTLARSMLAFNTCTNYGAQNFLSVPGVGCSSEATGKGSGMAGLIYSAALKYGVADLRANEVMQLLMGTADDIDVPESRVADKPPYHWSQPGFDQRFGYGRVNAGAAVEAVKNGRIPPEVNIVSPLWFENLYRDQITGPVPILGTIAAHRATSYDYQVEWAPGVQPLDDAFKPLGAKVENVAGTVVTGEGGTPIGMIDLSQVDPTHEPDPDSKMGENKDTFTIRVRAVAHYGGEIGDVKGELRRAYQVHEDSTLLPGFPYHIDASGESSPKLVDLDGDGKRDIILADGNGVVHALTLTATGPKEMPGFPYKAKRIDGLDPDSPTAAKYLDAPAYKPGSGLDPDTAREAFIATAAVGDVDGDGTKEIVATSWAGTIYVIRKDGTNLPGFPHALPYIPSCPTDKAVAKTGLCMDETNLIVRGAMASPVLADLNQDGKLDIIQAAFDGNVYAFDGTGAALPGWPVLVHYDGLLSKANEHNRVLSTPTVGDFNGDKIPDIFVGSNEKLSEGGNVGAYYLIDGRGTQTPGATGNRPGFFPNWPVTVSSLNLFPLIAEGVTSAGAMGDIDGDGVPEALCHGNGTSPLVFPTDPGAQATLASIPPNILPKADQTLNGKAGVAPTSQFGDKSKARAPDTMFPLFAQPSIGDLNLDGQLDLVTTGGSLSLAVNLASKGAAVKDAQQLIAAWDGKTGSMFDGMPVPVEDYTFFNNQAIVDLSGDGFPEIVTGTGGYMVHAVDACGREAPGFPKQTGGWVIATVAVGDLDGDGSLDAVTSTRDGWIFAWKTEAKPDTVIQWESFHHDERNTGNYAEPLDQGVKTKSVGKLSCGDAAGGSSGAAGSSAAGAAGTSAGAAGAAAGSAGRAGAAGSAPAPAASDAEGGCDCATTPGNGSVPGSTGIFAGLLAGLVALVRRKR